jgi:hypothetical protein
MNEKHYFLTTLFFLFTLGSYSQNFSCGFDELRDNISSNPGSMNIIQAKKNYSPNLLRQAYFTNDSIPVIVHVVDNTGSMSVSDASIQNMIDRLNTDFAKLNADTSLIPSAFLPLAASVPYRFCLARRAMDGSFTSGIIRVSSTHAPFANNFADILDLENSSSGGSNNWPYNYCFNIYITDIIPTLAGFATLGSQPVVIDYTAVQNRTITHEMGHSFGLQHIWGTSATGSCTDDDGIADTPLQWGPSSLCPTFPAYDSCTSSGDGINFVNYMDYSFCNYMFTTGQANEMISKYTTEYATLDSSNACDPVRAVDAGITIQSPQHFVCNPIVANINLRNFGLNDLTSVQINYSIDSGPVQSVNWNGLLHHMQTVLVPLPPVSLSSASHTIYVYSDLPNGTGDMYTSNDTTFTIFLAGNGTPIPFAEDFEDTALFNQRWQINNPQNDNTWVNTTIAAHSGMHSMLMDNKINPAGYARMDDLITVVDVPSGQYPLLTFYEAYTYASNAIWPDTLRILVSTDGGTNYSEAVEYIGDSLKTAPPINSGVFFVPLPTQWKLQTVDLSAYVPSGGCVLIKFQNQTGLGLQLYLDDININGNPVGIDENLNDPGISIYPVPVKNKINLNFNNSDLEASDLSFDLSDYTGKVINRQKLFLKNGKAEIKTDEIGDGFYILNIYNERYLVSRKIIVLK